MPIYMNAGSREGVALGRCFDDLRIIKKFEAGIVKNLKCKKRFFIPCF